LFWQTSEILTPIKPRDIFKEQINVKLDQSLERWPLKQLEGLKPCAVRSWSSTAASFMKTFRKLFKAWRNIQIVIKHHFGCNCCLRFRYSFNRFINFLFAKESPQELSIVYSTNSTCVGKLDKQIQQNIGILRKF